MQVTDLPIHGAKLFTLDRHGDNRGWFAENFRQSWGDEYLNGIRFIFECTSFTANAGTVRGLHAQSGEHAQSKLVTVLNGSLTDVIVDARIDSATYGQSCSVTLTDQQFQLVFVPRGCYHGFVTLTPNTYFMYKLDNYHAPDSEVGVMYNDPALNINWNLEKEPTLSNRDQGHPTWDAAYKFTGLK